MCFRWGRAIKPTVYVFNFKNTFVMFQQQLIKEAFRGLVGLKQNYDTNYPTISPDLVYTGSNLLVEHPLLNIENITLTAKNFAKQAYQTYDPTKAYKKYSLVNYTIGGVLKTYEALQDIAIGIDPTNNAWLAIDPINIYLRDAIDSTSIQIVNEMFGRKRDLDKTKTLIMSLRFYEGFGNLNDRIINTGRLVGVRIDLVRSQNIVSIIERIGLQLTGASMLTMYIYHSSMPQPIATVAFNHTNPGGFQWVDPATPIQLHNLNQQYDTGGSFFLMYDQNELASQAVNRRMNFNIPPCSGCSMYNGPTYQKISRYISIRACHVEPQDRVSVTTDDDGNIQFTPNVNGTDMWNIDRIAYDIEINWGLNFDFTVRCDLTEFITRQKDVFQYALRDNVLLRLLSGMSMSTRQNGITTIVQQQAQVEINSNALGGGGLRDKASKEIDRINFEMSALDQVCMPCANNNGIKVRSVGLSNQGNNLTGGY